MCNSLKKLLKQPKTLTCYICLVLLDLPQHCSHFFYINRGNLK